MDCCGPSPTAGGWRVREVSWRRVAQQQDYGSMLSTLVVVVALAITQGSLGGPRDRPFMVTDASISFPYNEASTIPYWVAIVASVVALVASVLLAELWLARDLHADASDAVAAVVHFLIDGISAFLVAGLVTTVSKMVVGRLRPDYLSRCQPAVPFPVTVQYGLPTSANPACTVAESGELADGLYSFPSGHTSTVFVFSVWTAAYCTWAFNMRNPRKVANSLPGRSLGQRLLHDTGTAGGFIWILAVLGYAWGVGVSRITDFKHHPSDVIGGAFLGTLCGAAFVVRAIARAGCVAGADSAACGGRSDGTPNSLLLNGHRVHPNHSESSV